jgi:hypothetical protein
MIAICQDGSPSWQILFNQLFIGYPIPEVDVGALGVTSAITCPACQKG